MLLEQLDSSLAVCNTVSDRSMCHYSLPRVFLCGRSVSTLKKVDKMTEIPETIIALP